MRLRYRATYAYDEGRNQDSINELLGEHQRIIQMM